MGRFSLGIALSACLAVSCSTQVQPTNPYDPNTPAQGQAPGKIRGALKAATLASPAGLALTLSANNKVVRQGTTAADGSFVFDQLQPGGYVLQSSPDGFVPLSLPVTVQAGDDIDLGTLTLSPLAQVSTIEGVATLAGESDSSGILVEVVGRSYATVTGATGAYGLTVVAGTYTLRFSHKDFVSQSKDSVTVALGQTVTVPAVALPANPATLSGHVDGELAAGGKAPLAGATVTLEGTSITGLTSATGDFTLTGIPAGSYLVRVISPPTFVEQTQATLNLAGGEVRALPDAFLLPLARGGISGTVQLAGIADASGVVVHVAGTPFSQTTGSAGTFEFDGLPVGVYEVDAQAPGFVSQTLASAVTVTQGGLNAIGTFTLLANPATIGGMVSAEVPTGGFAALQGASLSLDGVPSVANAHSGPTGTFAITGVPPGSYVVRASASGYADETATALNLTGGEVRALPSGTFQLSLLRGGIDGIVSLPDNADWSGIIVEITGTNRAQVTGADGKFEFDGLLTGVYEVTARRDGYLRQVLASAATVSANTVLHLGATPLVKQGGGVTVNPYTQSLTVTLSLSANSATGFAASEDPTFSDETKGDCLTCADAGTPPPHQMAPTYDFTFASNAPDGLHTIYVIFFNGVNQAPPTQAQVILDRLAPQDASVQINGGVAYTNAQDAIVTLTLSAFDLPPSATPTAAVSGLYQMRLANSSSGCADAASCLSGSTWEPFNRAKTWTLDTPGTDGLKTVYAQFRDGALNASAAGTAAVTLDRVGPTGTSVSLVGPASSSTGYTSSPLVTASLTATDSPGESLTVQLSNSSGFVGAITQPFASQITWLLTPGDGVKTVYAVFQDNAGNVGTPVSPVSGTINLKTTPPSSPTLGLATTNSRQNGYTHDPNVTLSLSAANGATVAQITEDPSFATYTSVNLVGQLLPLSTAWKLSVDGGVTSVDGLHTVYARYLDAAGNQSLAASASVTLLRTPPLSLLPTLVPGPIVNSASVTLVPPPAGQSDVLITGNVTGQGSYVAAPPGMPIVVTLATTDGPKTLNLTWRDLADNTTVLSAITVTLEAAAPSAAPFTVSGTQADGTRVCAAPATPACDDVSANPTHYVSSTAVTLDFSGQTDPVTSITQMKISNLPNLSDALWQPFSGSTAVPWTLTSGDGLKTVYALFQNAAGNSIQTAVTGSIHLLGTPPSATSISIQGGAAATNVASGSNNISLTLAATGAAQMAISQDNFASGVSWVGFSTSATTSFTGTNVQATKTVYARFRNAAHVEGPPAQASIFWNIVPPSAAGWTLSLIGSLGSQLGPSSVYTSAAGVTAQLVPPAAGIGYVTGMAFAQVASNSCTGAFSGTPTFAPYQASSPLTLTGSDGTKYLCVTFQDNAGNTNTASTALGSIILEAAGPATGNFLIDGAHADGSCPTTGCPDTALTATPVVTLDFSGETDSISGVTQMKVANDAATALAGVPWEPYAKSLSWTLSPGDSTTKQVFALFRNGAGNASLTAVSGTINLDTTPPAVTSTSLTTTAYSKTLAIPITIGADGTDVKAVVSENPSLSSGATTYTRTNGSYGTTNFTLGGSGPRVVYARFYDAAANASALVSAGVTVILPAQGPLALPFALSPAAYTNLTSIALTPPAAAANQSITISGDISATYGPALAPAGVPINLTLTGTSEGVKNINAVYTDPAGNTASPPAQTITYDHTAPAAVNFVVSGKQADGTALCAPPSTTSCDATANVSSTAVTLDLSHQTDATSGMALMKISNLSDLSDAVWQPFNPSVAVPWTLSAGDGLKTVYAIFQDKAGNATTAPGVTGTIHLATIAPSGLSISAPALTSQRCVTLTLSASGPPTDMAFSINGFTSGTPAFSPYATSTTIDVLTGGACNGAAELTQTQAVTVSVIFRNAARVPSAVASTSLVYDHDAPSATGWTLTLSGPAALGALSSTATHTPSSVTVQLTPPAAGAGDAVQAALVQAANCSGAFGSPSWVSLAPSLSFPLTGADGTKRVCAILRDAAGNFDVTSFVSGTILVDTAAPSPALTAFTITGTLADTPPTSSTLYTETQSVTVNLSGQTDPAPSSGIAFMKISNRSDLADAAWQPFVGSTPVPWTVLPGDGAKTVYVQLQDNAGNISGNLQNVTPLIILAQTPPSGGSLLVNSGAPITNNRLASLSISAIGAADMAVSTDGFSGTGEPNWGGYQTSVSSFDLLNGATNANVEQQVVVSIRFRNHAHVEGGGTSATIYYDHTSPAAGTLTLSGSLGTGAPSSTSSTISNNPAISAALTKPSGSDANTMAVAQLPGTFANCTAFFQGTTPNWQPFAYTTTVVLTGSDGPKTVCAVYQDAAGNYDPTTAMTASITLDTTPPTNPGFVNFVSGYTNLNVAPAPPATGTLITAATDNIASSVTYQCLGGTYAQWTDCGTTTTLSLFQLGSPPADGQYTLGVRARDNAYNYSSGSFVLIVRDTAAPAPPVINSVVSQRNSISVSWTPSSTPGVVEYLVNYGTATGNTSGTGAAQGNSPVPATGGNTLDLTDLVQGTPYFISVVAVDQAGNRSQPSGERETMPNEVNPRLTSVIGGSMLSTVLLGTHLYAAGIQSVSQFDVTSDAATPTGTAPPVRVTVPNVFPTANEKMAALACSYRGTPGECVYLPGNSSSQAPGSGPVQIVFFANNGSFRGVIGTLATQAYGVTLVSDGASTPNYYLVTNTNLPTASGEGITVYALGASGSATAAAPALRNSSALALSSTGVSWTRTLIAGAILKNFYLLAYTSDGAPAARVINFGDITAATLAAPVDLGVIYDQNGAAVVFNSPGDANPQPPSNAIFTDSGLDVFYAIRTGSTAPYTYTGYTFLYPNLASSTHPSTVGVVYPSTTSGFGGFADLNLAGPIAFDPKFSMAYVQAAGTTAGGGFQAEGWAVQAGFTGTTAPFVYSPPGTSLLRARSFAAGTIGGALKLFAIDDNTLYRWVDSTGSFLYLGGSTFRDVLASGAVFDVADHYLFVSQGATGGLGFQTIITYDVSNPLNTREVARYTSISLDARGYTRLRARGGYLYASGYNSQRGGLDILKINPNGSLTLANGSYQASYDFVDLALGGKYVFLLRATASAGIMQYDVSNPAQPSLVTSYLPPSGATFTAIDADDDTVYAAGYNSANTIAQTFTIGNTTGWPVIYPSVANPTYATLIPPYLFVSSSVSTTIISVSSPTSPYAYDNVLPVSGPVVFQDGYVIGPPPFGTSDGLRFVNSSGVVAGTVPNGNCGNPGGGTQKTELVYQSGVYYTACSTFGIEVTPIVNAYSGRLVSESTEATSWVPPNSQLIIAGPRLFLGGPIYYSGTTSYQNTIWTGDTSSVASGTYPYLYPETTTVPSGQTVYNRAISYDLRDQVLIVGEATLNQIESIDVSSTYVSKSTAALTGAPNGSQSFFDDGRWLYQPVTGPALDIIDGQEPAHLGTVTSVTLPSQFDDFAVYRGRLYGIDDSSKTAIDVYDVSAPPALGTTPKPLLVSNGGLPAGATLVNGVGLTVAGNDIFYIYQAAGGEAVGISRLSSNGDGDTTLGATYLVSTPFSSNVLAQPVISGDALLLIEQASLDVFDLTPFWTSGAAPVHVGGQAIDSPFSSSGAVIRIDGPFAYYAGVFGSGGGSMRIFDLR